MKKTFLFILLLISISSIAQVKISALPASSATNVDSLTFAIVDAGTTKKIKGYQLKALFLSGQIKNISPVSPVFIDSISPLEYEIGVDLSGLGITTSFVMTSTEPTDTTVAWINTNYNIYRCFPVQYRVNGQWSAVDTVGGQFWDDVGKVFTRGYPFIIIATGQSNLGGSYIGEATNPNASPYNGYYGDTIPARGVAAWNNNQNIWTVAKIRDTPFQYSSGANYLLLASKKFYERTGRSVRIVTYPQGGTGLQCWSGVPGTPPQDSACYNEFKSRIQNSGVRHPNVFIWAQSEAGITPTPYSEVYSDKWLEMRDTMTTRDHLIDTSTLIILMASGDTLTNGNVLQMGDGTSAGEGALRALAATNDPYIKYISAYQFRVKLSDGLHLLPKGHEEAGTALFHSIIEGPKVPGRDMMGYKQPAPYKWSSEEQRVGLGGLVAINSNNKAYFGLGVDGNSSFYTAAEPNLSNQYAPGLIFRQDINTATLWHYNGTTKVQLEDTRVLTSNIVAQQSVEAYSGGDPEFVLNDITTNRKWKFRMVNGSNELHFIYNNTDLFHFTASGELAIGVNTPHASAVVDLTSTTKGLLPPRMTTAERNLIASPAAGLTLYCTDCTATDASTGVLQTYNGATFKNHW